MKLNENIAISTPKVLLVPYDRRHVPRYHEWMSDPEIQEATASEPLTLEEEYENQESWRASHDKLTFILCRPVTTTTTTAQLEASDAIDGPARMIGDVNFFLHACDDGACAGEVDIMIADVADRGQGIGRAAVATLLHYVWSSSSSSSSSSSHAPLARLGVVMAKIRASNARSIALFEGLGFAQEGGVDYFGEVKLVLKDLERLRVAPEGYEVLRYVRPAA